MNRKNKLIFVMFLAIFLFMAFSNLNILARASNSFPQYNASLDTENNPTETFECVDITLFGVYSIGTQPSSNAKVAVQNNLNETKYIELGQGGAISRTNVTFLSEVTSTGHPEILLSTLYNPTTSFGGYLIVTLNGVYRTGTSEIKQAKITISNKGVNETKFISENTSDYISGVKVSLRDAIVTTPGTNEGEAEMVLHNITLYSARIQLEKDGNVETKYVYEKENKVIARAHVSYLGRYLSDPPGSPHIKLRVINPVTDVSTINVGSTENLAGLDITVYGIYQTGTGDDKQVKITASDGVSEETKFFENDTVHTMLGALVNVQDIYEASPTYSAKLTVSTDYVTETKFIEDGSSDTIAGVGVQVLSADKFSKDTNEGYIEVLLNIPKGVCKINETINETIEDPINETINETIEDPINETINETIEETINETINKTLKLYTQYFIKGNKIEGRIVMGKGAAAPDVQGVADIAQYLGAVSGSTQSVSEIDEEISPNDKQSNLILVGGPAKNSLVEEINPKLPVKFELRDGLWYLIGGSVEYDGYNDPNVGVLEMIENPNNPDKKIIVAAGLTRWGTKAATNLLSQEEHLTELTGTALIIRYKDGEVEILEKVSSGLPPSKTTGYNILKRLFS